MKGWLKEPWRKDDIWSPRLLGDQSPISYEGLSQVTFAGGPEPRAQWWRGMEAHSAGCVCQGQKATLILGNMRCIHNSCWKFKHCGSTLWVSGRVEKIIEGLPVCGRNSLGHLTLGIPLSFQSERRCSRQQLKHQNPQTPPIHCLQTGKEGIITTIIHVINHNLENLSEACK